MTLAEWPFLRMTTRRKLKAHTLCTEPYLLLNSRQYYGDAKELVSQVMSSSVQDHENGELSGTGSAVR